jgi:5-formyltetrahydrofolate cyclo-ligase
MEARCDKALSASKKEIRERLLSERDTMPPRDKGEAEQAITRTLLSLPEYAAARLVFCYVGVRKEIRTMPFIEAALAAGKRVCVPRRLDGETMEAREITGANDLRAASFGLMEPKEDCPSVRSDKIELAVIPCLACDLRGYRLGYGAGYYDRYMVGANYARAALCMETALFGSLPAAEFDIKVSLVITEKRVHRI